MGALIITTALLFITGVVTAQELETQNVTVLVNSEARFNCSVTSGWGVMVWLLKQVIELTILESSGVVNTSTSTSNRFSAVDFSSGGISTWEFIIKSAMRQDSGAVSCQILGRNPVTTQLSVQQSGTVAIEGGNRTATENDQLVFQCIAMGWFPEPDISWAVNGKLMGKEFINTSFSSIGDVKNSNSTLRITALNNSTVECLASVPALATPLRSTVFVVVEKIQSPTPTVLIAIIVSCIAAVLLVIIIIFVVLCCRKRKREKSSYQEQARARALRETATNVGDGQGNDNLGYVTDGQHADDSKSEISNDGSLQPNGISVIEVPYGSVYGNPTYGINGVKKHRHATLV